MPKSDADRELMELQRSITTQGHAAGQPMGAADPEVITTFEQRRAAQREAYGQFVAIAPIHIGNCLAFNVGQPVPLEHVIRYDLEAQEVVARVANPEQARAGKRFESDDEFLTANPHVAGRQSALPEAHPDALDPRGGAAHLDSEGRHASKPAGKQADDKSEPSKARRTPAGGEKAEG